MDPTKIKPYGAWVLVKPDPTPRILDSGLYMPDGNLFERIGFSIGTVLAVGPGNFNKSKKAGTPKYCPLDVKVGDRVVFRGYQQNANRPGGVDDREFSMFMGRPDPGGRQDLLAIIREGKLEPSLPYDNQ